MFDCVQYSASLSQLVFYTQHIMAAKPSTAQPAHLGGAVLSAVLASEITLRPLRHQRPFVDPLYPLSETLVLSTPLCRLWNVTSCDCRHPTAPHQASHFNYQALPHPQQSRPGHFLNRRVFAAPGLQTHTTPHLRRNLTGSKLPCVRYFTTLNTRPACRRRSARACPRRTASRYPRTAAQPPGGRSWCGRRSGGRPERSPAPRGPTIAAGAPPRRRPAPPPLSSSPRGLQNSQAVRG